MPANKLGTFVIGIWSLIGIRISTFVITEPDSESQATGEPATRRSAGRAGDQVIVTFGGEPLNAFVHGDVEAAIAIREVAGMELVDTDGLDIVVADGIGEDFCQVLDPQLGRLKADGVVEAGMQFSWPDILIVVAQGIG